MLGDGANFIKHLGYGLPRILKLLKRESVMETNLNSPVDSLFSSFRIDGRLVFPTAGYLCLVWKALAQKRKAELFREGEAVVFENVELKKTTNPQGEEQIEKLTVNILESGLFEIIKHGEIVVTGEVRLEAVEQFEVPSVVGSILKEDALILTRDDVYKELRLRGYEYSEEFQGITQICSDGTWATVRWANNWTTFMDSMLQLEYFSIGRSLSLPVRIDRVSIQPKEFLDGVRDSRDGYEACTVFRNHSVKLLHCKGVEIQGIHMASIRREIGKAPVLEGVTFAAFKDSPDEATTMEHGLAFCISIVEDNSPYTDVSANRVAICSPEDSKILPYLIRLVSRNLNFVGVFVEDANQENLTKRMSADNEINAYPPLDGLVLLVLNGTVPLHLPAASFTLYIGTKIPEELSHLTPIALKNTEAENIYLLVQPHEDNPSRREVVTISPPSFQWVEELQGKLREGAKIDIVSRSGPFSGILGFVQCLRKEPGFRESIRCYFYKQTSSCNELQERPLLAFNVHDSGRWGSYFSVDIQALLQTPGGSKADSHATTLSPADLSIYFHAHKSYVIIGALAGFTLELVDWMSERGARKFILNSRSVVTSPYQDYRLKFLRENRNCQVVMSRDDVTSNKGTSKVLLAARRLLGPIGGIFNLAEELRDGLFLDQSKEDFEVVAGPKVGATFQMDNMSRALAPELDYFVVFSSNIAVGRGNSWQTSYGYANSYMEQVCEQRRKEGLPGLAVRWGALGDNIRDGNDNKIDNGVVVSQTFVSCLQTLDMFLQQRQYSTVSSYLYSRANDNNSSSSSTSG